MTHTRLPLLAALVLGVMLGWLLAWPTWEVSIDRALGIYVSGQPSYPAEGHRARVTRDGYLRIERVSR